LDVLVPRVRSDLLEQPIDYAHIAFEEVASDPRHQHVKLLVLRPAEQRIFSDWGMGLLDLDGYGEAEHRDLKELIKLAHEGDNNLYGTPVEMAILSRFCMLLPAG
ncbi:MAG: BLUF domain-containing protein, partial [Planctomycetota bacterium]